MSIVYAIEREKGVFVDRGGRRTSSIPQIFFWNDRDAAQAFLDKGHEKMYVWPHENLEDFEVVAIRVEI